MSESSFRLQAAEAQETCVNHRSCLGNRKLSMNETLEDALEFIQIFIGIILIGWIPGAIAFILLSPLMWLMGMFGN